MISLKSRIMLVSVAGLLSLTACNAEENTGTSGAPAVKVNGVAIDENLVNLLVKERQAQGQPDSPQLRRAIREDLVARELMAQEARKQGLNSKPEVKSQMELASQSVLVRAYLQDFAKAHPVSEAAMKAEYEKLKTVMGDKEYLVRHILVAKESEAQDIEAQLKKGAKFEQLAKEKSKDPSGKSNGGALGWVAPGGLVKPFADAMVKLQKGQTSGPVQSEFGWHIIRLEDIRPMKAPPYDTIKDGLRQRVEQQEVQKMIADLRAKAKVEGLDK